MTQKKMLLIFNPKSGVQKFPASLFDVVDKFTAAGFLVTAYPTQAPGEVGKMVAECAGLYDYIVCSGGDGTIGEAIGAMLPLGKRPVFGLIPSGTVNDFAMSLGLPKDILMAADVITNGAVRPLDIGRFGGKHFSYVAAFGLFTDVSYATPQGMKNMLGNFAYLLEGIKRLGSIKTFRCRFTLDDEVVSGDFVLGMVANAQSVGGIRLPEEIGVRMDDGMFEVILLQRPENLIDMRDIIRGMLDQEIHSDSLIVRKVSKVAFTATKSVAWTLDGEFGGEYRKIDIENCKHAIEVMLPREEI